MIEVSKGNKAFDYVTDLLGFKIKESYPLTEAKVGLDNSQNWMKEHTFRYKVHSDICCKGKT